MSAMPKEKSLNHHQHAKPQSTGPPRGVIGFKMLEREKLKFEPENGHLGDGSYSTVRQAYSGRLRKQIAVKIIDRSKASQNFLDKFLPRELKVLKQLKNRN